ncbi:hypothetical protein HQ496_07035 [bacterium]|nr:hypothetical protein [bacterium]
MKNGLFNIFKKAEARPSDVHIRPDASGQAGRTTESLIDQKLIRETVQDWMAEKDGDGLKLDRVLSKALDEGLITVDDITMWCKLDSLKERLEETGFMMWRDIVRCDPWRSLQMERVAARVYGFRSVLICQMSTLVLADMMAPKVSPKMWDQLFEKGLAPVVEHGNPPVVNGRIVCVSKDPSNREIRGFVNSLTEFKAELTYADAPVVKGVLEMVAQHVPLIGAAVYTSRPALQKVLVSVAPTKRAA